MLVVDATRAERAEILARLDLVDLLEELTGVEPSPRPRRSWPCPSPTHQQTGATPPVSIYRTASGEKWKCHGCGEGGTAIDLLAVALGLDIPAAFGEARRRAGLPERPRREPVTRRAATPSAGARRLDPAAAAALVERFAAERGWDADVVARAGLTGVLDRQGVERVRFPFRAAGETRWWQDRRVDGRPDRKYLAPPAPAWPYAVDLATFAEAVAEARVAIVVEGPSDAVALAHVAGLGELVIAAPGATSSVVRRIAPIVAAAAPGAELVIATDADPAGDAFRGRLVEAARAAGLSPVTCRPPDGLDVDEWRRLAGEHFAEEFFAGIVDAREGAPE